MSTYNIEQMDSFQRGVSRMNAEILRMIADLDPEEQDLNEIVLEELQEPLITERKAITEEVEVVERKRRGRPITRDITLLRNQLQTFRSTSYIGQEFPVDLRGNLTLREGADVIFDVLAPYLNERFGVFTHFDEDDNERFYPISETGRTRIESLVRGELDEDDATESDRELIASIRRADRLRFVRLPDYDPTARQRRRGAFFKHRHKTALDLTKYGVYGLEEKIPDSVCLIVALEQGGLCKKKIDRIKIMIHCNHIPVCQLQNICDSVEICIELKQLRINTKDNNKKTHTKTYGNPKNEKFNIGLVDGHYFIIDKTNITSYALEHHYDDVSKFNIIHKSGRRDNGREKDSFYVISYMYENKEKYLIPLTANDMIKSIHHDKLDLFTSLDYNEVKDVQEVKYKASIKTTLDFYDKILFIDFETDTSNGTHTPYLMHYIDNDDKTNTEHKFIGSNCAMKFLMSLTCNTLLYAHNAGYDFRFLVPHLIGVKPLMRGSSLITCSGLFHNYYTQKTYRICIKDSYKIISAPLRKFGSMFQLEQEKEVMPYSIYTTKNIRDRYVSVDELKKCPELKNKNDFDRFMSNCMKWNVLNVDKVDIITYSSKYCHIDCVVLKNGFNKFRQWMLEVVDIDIHNVVSIPSLVHQYMVRVGVYDGCYQTSSVPRAFMQKCLTGGRVMCADNQKLIVDDCILNDFDAVSLYPSAMKRLADIGGFLKGKPKVLLDNQLNYEFLKRQDGYFVKILIKRVGINLSFPYMSFINDDGVREFTNKMVGREMFVDKISLEDFILNHDIDFDVLQGYYFNEGRNNKIGLIIETLFNERLKKKKEGNPIQEVYKLIMNSAYGKTLLKPIENSLCVVDSEASMKKYVVNNFDVIEEVIPMHSTSGKYIIKTKNSIQKHENLCQVGIEILSMSKRIMAEVMVLAEQNELKMYYTDTDSIHIKNEHISKLEELYKQKYGRDLIGKGMGQFHSDFSLTIDGKSATDVVSICGIFLGKKCYLDVLQGYIDGDKVFGYHIRMKSIPSTTISYEADEQYEGDVKKMYIDLYNSVKVKFDLLEGGRKCRFDCGSNLSVKSLDKFIRVIGF